MIYLKDIFSLLTDSVHVDSAINLKDKCLELGMVELRYQNLGFDSSLPEFDKGFILNFNTEDELKGLFEIMNYPAASYGVSKRKSCCSL